ncbi:MAG: DUF4339 domain-containing protein [Planctomycetota bacterium]
MEILIHLIFPVIFGSVSSLVARSKGRNAIGWFFGGFFLGLLGLIIICVLSNLKEEAAKEKRVRRENRRLREQLRQEQIKGESFRRHAAARLDAHDQQLNLDTRQAAPALTTAAGPQPDALPEPVDTLETAEANAPEWFYEEEGEAVGPLPRRELRARVRSGELDAGALVWNESMEDWTPLRSVPELQPRKRKASQ